MKRTKGRQNKKVSFKRRRLYRALIIATILIAVIFTFSRNKQLSEWYMQSVYPGIATILSTLSGIFPFSVYDIFIVAASVWVLRLVILLILGRTGFMKFLYSVVSFSTILIAWFYFGWGISYFREDFYEKSEIEKKEFDADGFKEFAAQFIEHANESYIEFNVLDKAGIRQDIEMTYSRLQEPLNINYPNGKRKVKQMIFESIFTKMGVSGYFGPFFNEIHVNDYSLNFSYPFTLAHEMAHQFGIAAESEANLYAFIICVNSNDERVRYSAYISTIGYVLNDIRRFIPDDYNSLVADINPDIVRDLNKNREHWMTARDESLSDMQDKVYDTYLKTNRVSSGRANYSEVVGLLISWYDTFLEE